MDQLKDFLTAPSIILNDDGETVELNGQAIFSVGFHKGQLFNREDIDAMVENFNALKTFMKVPAKLGHGSGEENYGYINGKPAVGLIKSMRREGAYLIADFTKVPVVVAKAIQRKQYLTKSSEIILDYDWGFVDSKGKELGPVVVGVAFLGEEIPAVPDLNDLDTLFSLDNSQIDFSRVKSLECSFKHDFSESNQMNFSIDKTESSDDKVDSEISNEKPEENVQDGIEEEMETEIKTENSIVDFIEQENNKSMFNFSKDVDRVIKILDKIEQKEASLEEYKPELDMIVTNLSGYDPQEDFNDPWMIFEQVDKLRAFSWISKKLKELNYEIPKFIIEFKKYKSENLNNNNNNNFEQEDLEMENEKLNDQTLDAIKIATEESTKQFSERINELTEKLEKTTLELEGTKGDLLSKEAENSKLNSIVAELAKDREDEKERHISAKIDEIVTGWVKEGKVLPKQTVELKAALKTSSRIPTKVSFAKENADGKMETIEKSHFEILNDVFNNMPKQVEFSETAVSPVETEILNKREEAKFKAEEIAAKRKNVYKTKS